MSGLAGIEGAAEVWIGFLLARAPEATALALAILLVAAVRRVPASIRYGLLVVALLKFLMPPLSAPWSRELHLPQLTAAGVAMERVADARPGNGAPPRPRERSGPIDRLATATAPSSNAAPIRDDPPAAGARRTSAADGATRRPTEGVAIRATGVLFAIQLLGSLVLLLRHLAHRGRLRILARRCQAVDSAPLRRAVDAASRRQGLRRAPALVVSPDRLGPAAVGLLRRVIVLPARVVDAMPPARLQPVIEHEVAHHRRGDLWIDLVVFAGSLLWWMNPIYWLLARRLRAVREECCDEVVVAVTPVSAYCQTLLDVAAALGGARPTLPALAQGTLAHPLGRRIRRMMDRSYRPRPALSNAAAGLLFAVALLALPAATEPTAQAAEAAPQAARASTRAALPPETPFAPSQSWIFSEDRIELSEEAIEILIDRGIEPAFAEQMERATNRRLTLAELRDMSRHGFDPRLADELDTWGVREIHLGQLLRLVILDADVEYIRSLRDVGYDHVGVDGVIRLARYDIVADWIREWQDGGYTDLSVDGLVRLTRYEVRPSYAATYLEAGYELSVDDLVRLHRYEVDERAAQRLADAGLDDFTVDDLVRLKRYEVSDAYIRAVTEDGDVEVSVDGLVTLDRYQVSVEDIRGFRASGIDPSIDDLVRLARYEVTPTTASELVDMGYAIDVDGLVTLTRYEVPTTLVRALRASGYEEISIEEIVRLKRYEVGPQTIRAMATASGRRFSVDELVKLKRYEISPDYVRGMAEVGYPDLSVDDLVRLKRYEVSADFIRRLQAGGFDDLTVDRIIRLKRADT